MYYFQPLDPEVLGDRYQEEQELMRNMAKEAFLRESKEPQWEYDNGY
jgi:hypothetical protein